MAAEIAVLNRSAVALAADSATTILTRRGIKINNNPDKFFHLSDRAPVGLMMFGNAEFMEQPLESLIKPFRFGPLGVSKPTVGEYAAALFEFFEHNMKLDDDIKRKHIETTFRSVANPLLVRSTNILFASTSTRGQSIADRLAALWIGEFDQEFSHISDMKDFDVFEGISAEDLSERYGSIVRQSLERQTELNPPQQEILERLVTGAAKFFGLHLKKEVFSEQSSNGTA